MSIKVKCSKCGAMLSVPDSAAGKKVKCKCGTVLSVPAAKKEPSAPGIAAIDPGIFDQLDEEDFQQQAPIDKLFAPKQAGTESSRLQQYVAEEKERLVKESKKTKAMIKVMSAFSMLFALGYFGLAGVALAAEDQLQQIAEYEPMVEIGTSVFAGFMIVWGLVMLAGSIGGFLVHKWGWFLLAVTYQYMLINRAAAVGFSLQDGFETVRFYAVLIPTLIALSLVVFFFREQTREVFGIKSVIPAVIAAVLGIGVGAAMVAVTYQARAAGQESSAAAGRLELPMEPRSPVAG